MPWMTHLSPAPFLNLAHFPYLPVLRTAPFKGLLTMKRTSNDFQKYPSQAE